MNKAQVSAEAIISVSMLLIILVFVFMFNANKQTENSFIEKTLYQKTECEKLVSSISLVNNAEGNSEMKTSIRSEINIIGNTINFPDYYCRFSGAQTSAFLSPGNIVITKENGAVTIENE